jgi:hypothetical protein
MATNNDRHSQYPGASRDSPGCVGAGDVVLTLRSRAMVLDRSGAPSPAVFGADGDPGAAKGNADTADSKAIAAPRDGLYQCLPVVSQRARAGSPMHWDQRIVGDDEARPHRGEELVLGDDGDRSSGQDGKAPRRSSAAGNLSLVETETARDRGRGP